MKTISPALQAHLDGELTTLADIVKITRADGIVKAFTTHDANIEVDGIIYKADGAFSSAAMKSGTDGGGESVLAVEGILDSAEIGEDDIKAGLYDGARVEFAVVNWADPSQGKIVMRRGWLGEVTLAGGKYIAELRGMRDLLQRRIGGAYTPECRYDLGGAGCGVDIESLKVSGSVTGTIDNSAFVDYMRGETDGYFNYGKIVWTSGANAGAAMEIKRWDALNQTFYLWLPMSKAIAVGNSYEALPGCDKRFSTCKGKYSNGVNFGGFPHLPGVDRILQYP